MKESFPAPSAIESGQHFHIVKKLVDEKLMQVVLFTGPPRCGTTATGKFGHEAVKSHVNVNQPGMFSRAGHMQYNAESAPQFVLSARDRNAGIWRRVYDQVFAYYNELAKSGQQPSTFSPILLSAKETTHLTLFQEEVKQWQSLAEDRVVMSIRSPILQMRSAMLMILDNIDTDIFSDNIQLNEHDHFTQDRVTGEHFNVNRYDDVRSFSVHGRPLFNLAKLDDLIKNKSFIEDETGKLHWPDTYQYIKANNDFMLLDDTALKRFSIYNPFLEEPEVQKEIWHATLNTEQYKDAIKNYLGTRMEAFHQLPDHLCDTLFRWRMGWLPTLMHLKQQSYPNLIVSEFTEMQTNSAASWNSILNKLRSRGLLPQDKKQHLPYSICVDQQCELPWKAWFLDQDYKTVLGHQNMTKPRNKPMNENQLPDCLRQLLPEAKEAYQLALSHEHVVGETVNSELSMA